MKQKLPEKTLFKIILLVLVDCSRLHHQFINLLLVNYQLFAHIQGICVGILVHNSKHSKRKKTNTAKVTNHKYKLMRLQ